MCANNGQESISFEELTCRVIPVDQEIRRGEGYAEANLREEV